MINWILSIFLATSTQSKLMPEHKMCSIFQDNLNITIVCSKEDKSFALTIDKINYGNYYFGQWNQRAIGFGFSGKKVLESNHQYCGYFEQRQYYNGINAEEHPDYEKNLSLVYQSIDRDKNLNGFIVSNEVDYFVIGEFKNNQLNGFGLQYGIGELEIGIFENGHMVGEGIYFNTGESRIIHGIWKKNKDETLEYSDSSNEQNESIQENQYLTIINLKELNIPEPNCNK